MDGKDETAATETGQPDRSEQREQWATLVEEHAGSGLSAAAFCRQRQVPVWQFYWWRQRLKDVSTAEVRGQSGGAFVRVAVTGAGNGLGPSGIAVRLSDGLVLIERGFDRATLREVLTAAAGSRP